MASITTPIDTPPYMLVGSLEETATGANPSHTGPTRASSTSSLSEAQDPDADAEGEPDDLDADADGIEDDDAMDYSYEKQDIDGTRIEDGEESAQDEEDEDAENEDEEDEDSGEEMDLDENASSPPPSPPSRLSDQTHPPGSDSSKKPLKLKLKLATQPAASAPPAKRKYVRKVPLSKSPSGRSRATNDKKAKRKDTEEEEDELAEDSLDLSDGELGDQGAYRASNGSDGASTGDDTMPTAGQLTVRQRAKEYGEPVTELQSLPMVDVKKKKELTEADRAMEKAEKSRKRKHQNEKKLEDEKTETINRLLKGQIGKAGRASTKTAGGAIDTAEENANQVVKAPAPPPLPTMLRTISSIRSGEYVASLSIPSAILKNQQDHFVLSSSPKVVYPPPVRPPPKTWKLVNGVRVN
ncbi:hypothetical protein PCASD_14839 [Puccinia coronata f. sp. avenae]|uniref:INO80 complex subunit B-like conserved region domain-containing protein n=1 Tax=Puccinia coronata f. sp. avenae TaxID=200324 RepID=A0A2N5TCG3_9BASI|nr:hypothetical protein PCASD_14839 [Puccinia coronata f. sp. avenae]